MTLRMLPLAAPHRVSCPPTTPRQRFSRCGKTAVPTAACQRFSRPGLAPPHTSNTSPSPPRLNSSSLQGLHPTAAAAAAAAPATPELLPLQGFAAEAAADAPEAGCAEERFWTWTIPGSNLEARVRYFQAGSTGPCLLLLHGFGVGAYHWERNIQELAKTNRVYAVDVLGQGASWPVRQATQEDALYMSIDTWRSQLRDFALQVMRVEASGPAYVAGNSLGGMLAVYLASMHPDLFQGVILLNATPFWSFRPALQAAEQGWWGLMPPGFGTVPVQEGLKSFIKLLWWNNLRRPTTIRSMLELVYRHQDSVDEGTVSRIVQATEQPMALDVFAAIALAPKPELGFDQCLEQLHAPTLMLYGREDPWVVPLWGRRLKQRVPSAVYLELSPAGHCPHHEVPNAVNWAIQSWIQSGHQPPVAEGAAAEVEEEGGRKVSIRNVGSMDGTSPSNWLSTLLERLTR